ncbi:MAG: hypothetical protein NXI04_24155 [Planctomycetaceae bacterium]|nr:hypothetical protein [Planctomycetaceae bacterium]
MIDDRSSNPYESPSAPTPSVNSAAAPDNRPLRATAVLLPPVLTVGATLIIWLSFANALNSRVHAGNVMVAWSSTLVLSAALSSIAVARIWPARLSPLSMALGFVLFGIVFCVLEGDTSNGTDPVQMTFLYGTLSAVPVLVFVIARQINKRWLSGMDRVTVGHRED